MSDGKITIETLLDSTGISKGISVIKSALAAVGIGMLANDIVSVGSSFESTMSQVGAISGATQSDLELLTQAAKDMGETSVFSATESASALTYMAMAGWKTQQMVDGLPGIMNLAAASGEDLASVSDIVTDSLTAFGKGAEESGKFADALASASSNANTNVSMLGESFKFVAPVAGSLGMSYQDVTTALGLMANAGIKGSSAGTALRSALTNLAKPTKQMKAYMEALGISLTDDNGNVKSLDEVMQNLRTSFADLSEAEQAEAASAIFGKEAMSGMLAIVNTSQEDYDKLKSAIENSSEAYDGLGTAAGMAQQMTQNFSGQMTLLGSALEGAKLAIWTYLEEPLTNLATVGTNAVSSLTTALKEEGVSGLADAASNLMMSFMKKVDESIPSVVVKGSHLVSNIIMGITRGAPQFISKAADMIISFATSMGAQLPTLIPQAVNMVVTLAQSFVANIPKLVQAGKQMISGLGEGVVNSIPIIIEKVPTLINDFFDAIYSGAAELIGAGLELIVKLGKGIVDNIPLIIANAKEIGKAVINIIMAIDMLKAGRSIMTKLSKGIKEKGPLIKEGLKTIGNKALETFKNINWIQLGKNVITFIANGIKALASLVTSGLKTIGTNGFNLFKSIDWLSLGKSVINLLVDGLKAVASLVTSALKTAGTSAMNGFKSISWGTLGRNIIEGIKNGITAAASSLYSSLKNLASNALNAAKEKLGIHSPSTEFRDAVGRWIPRGVAVGVDKDSSVAIKAIEDMSDDAVDTAKAAGQSISDAMEDSVSVNPGTFSDYYSDLVGMLNTFDNDIPAVKSAKMGISFDTVTRFKEIASAMGEELKEEFKSMKEDVKNGIKEGMKNVKIDLDGRQVGKGVATYVDEYLTT